MSGLRQTAKLHFQWLIVLTIIIMLMLWIKPKHENYQELWKRVQALEVICADVPSAVCRPSIGEQCQCD